MNIQHSSESNEYGSPHKTVDAIRTVLGGKIDTDPATSAVFNKYIKAKTFYTLQRSGYLKPFKGKTLLNPPGGLCEWETGRPCYKKTAGRESCIKTGSCGLPPEHKHPGLTSSPKAWWRRLAQNYKERITEAAVFVGFSLEIYQSAQSVYPDGQYSPYFPQHFPRCEPSDRLDFLQLQDGILVPMEQPTHSNVLVFMPEFWNKDERKLFFETFEPIGACTWPDRRLR